MAKELLSVQDFKNLPPVNFRIENVASLPTGLGTGDVGRIVCLTTDKMLYYWGGTAWSMLENGGAASLWHTTDYNCRYVHASFAGLGGRLYSTIQAAIDAADSGDCIVIYPGTYAEYIVVDEVDINFHFMPGAAIQITDATTDIFQIIGKVVHMTGEPRIIHVNTSNVSAHMLFVDNGTLFADNLQLYDLFNLKYDRGLFQRGGNLHLNNAYLGCGFKADSSCHIYIDAMTIFAGILINASNATGLEHYIHTEFIGKIVHQLGIMRIHFNSSFHNDSANPVIIVNPSDHPQELTLIDGHVYNEKGGALSLVKVYGSGKLRMKHVELRYPAALYKYMIQVSQSGGADDSLCILDNCTLVNTGKNDAYIALMQSDGVLKNWGSVTNCLLDGSMQWGTNYLVQEFLYDTNVG